MCSLAGEPGALGAVMRVLLGHEACLWLVNWEPLVQHTETMTAGHWCWVLRALGALVPRIGSTAAGHWDHRRRALVLLAHDPG